MKKIRGLGWGTAQKTLRCDRKRLRGLFSLSHCVIAALSFLLPASPAESAFSDRSATKLPADSAVSYNIVDSDINGDGAPDLFVSNRGKNLLLINDGSGTFTDESEVRLPSALSTTVDARFVDVDNDGDQDLLLANSPDTNSLWLNDGAGNYTDASNGRLPAQVGESMALGIADIDADGDLDVVVANRDGLNLLLINDGSGVFSDETGARGVTGIDPTFALSLVDVDGDGSDDIFFANRGAPNRLLINNGLGWFTDESNTRLPVGTGQSNGTAFSDIDGDGDQDILVADGANGLRLLLNDGVGHFTDETVGRLPIYAGFSVKVGIIDVEPDGVPDLLVLFGDSTRLYVNDGTGKFSDETISLVPANSQRGFGLAVLDLDNDLDQDFLVAAPGTQNRLLQNGTDLPRIQLSVSPDYIEVGDTAIFGVRVFDEEGVAVTTVTVRKPDTSEVVVPLVGESASYSADAVGLHLVTVVAQDNGGASANRSQVFSVQPPDSVAPSVSVALSTVSPLLGESVAIDVSATDGASGVESVLLLINGLPVPVDNRGHVDFMTETLGLHSVEAAATDRAGNTGSATPVQFDVQPDLVAPTVVDMTVTPDPVDLNTDATITISATDNVAVALLGAMITGPDTPPGGVTLPLTLSGGPVSRTGMGEYRPMLPGTYTLETTVRDPSGNETTASTTFEAVGSPDNEPPAITLAVVPHSVAIGGSIDLHVAATDNIGVITTVLEINGSPVTLDVAGNAVYTPPVVGSYSVVARAYDAWGNEGTAVDTLRAVNLADDVSPPQVEIHTPIENAELLGRVEIHGTVTDETLVSYRMEYAPVGGGFTEFASGSVEVIDGLLGILDTSGFSEGYYEVRLTAQDGNDETASISRYYLYVDAVQLGRFTLDYQDLTLPAMGLPIEVRRSYDSASDRAGDFGPGWRLSLLDSDLREDAQGNVFVTLPNGRRTAFAFRPRMPSPFFPIYLPEYQAPPGIYDKLETTDCSTLIYSGGQWFCDLVGGPFDPENYRITTKEGFVYDINQTRGVTRIEDRSGNYLEVGEEGISSHDSSGALVKAVVFNRDVNGLIASVVDPLGNTFNYHYDSSGRLIQTVDQQGNETDYTYYGATHLLDDVMTSGGCFPIKNIYDAGGNLVERQDSAGNSTTYAYDQDARTETVANARGFTTTYHYDTAGRVVQVDDALGTSTFNEYDDNGNRVRVVDPAGKVTRYTFDDRGNELTRTFEPEPATLLTFVTEYNTYGQVTRYVNPEGDYTEKSYDADGNLLRRELFDATGASIGLENFTYDTHGNRLSWTDAAGKTTSYGYNTFGDRTEETDPTGVTSHYEFDINGNRTAFIDGLGNRSEFTFNGLNKLTSMIHAGESLPRYVITYTAEGEMETLTDANGDTTTFHYGCTGNLVQVEDAHGQITDFGIDPVGNLSDITLTDGNNISYEYDGGNRLTGRIGPDG
ncbi:MAG: VCBS repeat-containing protein, partial [Gammaproteobacteria bacterium]|nr:VCBS repeat-containing protein [Gammaproteobacteria bacterium]